MFHLLCIFPPLQFSQKLETMSRRPSADVMRDAHAMGAYRVHISNIPGGNEAESIGWMENNSSMNPQGSLVIHQNGTPEIDNSVLQTSTGNQHYSESTKMNGSLKVSPGVQTGVDGGGVSQLSTPSSRSLSPIRYFQIDTA